MIHNFSVQFVGKSQKNDESNYCNKTMKNRNARVSSMYNVDDFDFAIILQSKDVYAYWAKLLDFRPEHGYDVCNLPQKD